jgi:hypothetical protein
MNCNGVTPEATRWPAGVGTGRGPRAWPRRTAPLAALVIAGAVVLAGCGGGSASPGSDSPGKANGGSTRLTGALTKAIRFSQCMRAHGITGYPDPKEAGGQISISMRITPGSDLNPHSPRYQAAQSACKAFRPFGNMTAAQKAAANVKALKYSQCMRSHGISSYPDPNGQGTISVAAGPGIDPTSPLFQRAQHACQSLENGFNMNTSNFPS